MDCFRSGLDAAAAAGPVLEGRAGCAVAVVPPAPPPPKKSSPSSESPALFCFGGTVSCLGGVAVAAGGPVLGRGGAGSSPKRSMAGGGR